MINYRSKRFCLTIKEGISLRKSQLTWDASIKFSAPCFVKAILMSIESHPIFKRSVKTPERFLFTSQDGFRVVLYQDSSVRYCHVSDPSYNFMPVEPSFPNVNHAVLSNSANLLLLYNSSEIRVVEVPWGYTNIPHQTFQKFRYVVEEQDPHIKQVLFHPLADREHCLVVLRSDDTISLLDRNYPQTMQPHEHVLNKFNGTLGMDSFVSNIKSIEFSLDGLILYALSVAEGGDIYAFYPCLPRSINLKANQLDLLMKKSLLQYASLDIQTPAATKRNTVKQFQFASTLRKKIEKDEEKLDISLNWLRVRGQGPFTIAPFPERYYERVSRQVALLPISSENELLLMSLDDGTIAILYKDLEFTMCWDSNGYTYNNSLVLIESIKLEAGNIRVLPGTQGQFYILGQSKKYLVDTTSWSQIFSSCIDNNDLQPIADLDFKSKIIAIDVPGEIRSCAAWNKGAQLFHVLISNEAVYTRPAVRKTVDKSNYEKDSIKSKIPEYKLAFSQPISEIMALNSTFQVEARRPLSKLIDPPKRQKPFLNHSNEDQLDILTDVSKEFLQKIVIAQSLGLTLHGRFAEQQRELTRQLQHSSSILEKQDSLKQKSGTQASDCEAKLNRQSKLVSRFNKLNDNLIRISESPKFKGTTINDKEMAWFKEIRNQVLTFNRYVHQQKDLGDQLQYVKQELDHICQEPDKASDRSNNEWKELLSILEKDTKIIEECNSQLAQSFREVEAEVSV